MRSVGATGSPRDGLARNLGSTRWVNSEHSFQESPGKMATVTTDLRKLGVTPPACGVPQAFWYARAGKRLFDIGASLASLALLSPIMIVCALLVRLTSRGPALFRQPRVGYRGRLFTVFKFRTMLEGAEALGSSVVVDRDARLTRIGTFLRRTKLDELPQLLNVLRGEMSIVGPRPRVQSEVDPESTRGTGPADGPAWTDFLCFHLPSEGGGLLCLARRPPEAYHTTVLPQKCMIDTEYVKNLTFLLDLKLIGLTFLLVAIPGRLMANKLGILRREVWEYSRGVQKALDLTAYVAAAWLAYTLWFEVGLADFYRWQMWMFILFIPLLRFLTHCALGVYDMIWRYINLEDGLLLAADFAPVTILLLILRLGLPRSGPATILLVPLGVSALEYLIALSAALGLRQPAPGALHAAPSLSTVPECVAPGPHSGRGLAGIDHCHGHAPIPPPETRGFPGRRPGKIPQVIGGMPGSWQFQRSGELGPRDNVTDVVVCAKSFDPNRVAALRQNCSRLGIKFHLLMGLDDILGA